MTTAEISTAIATKAQSVAVINGWAGNDAKAWRIAVDHVLGVGTYDRIAGEVYDELRAGGQK